MGRHNHENSVAVPGYGHPVVLSGDDTFSAPASQLYLYTARRRRRGLERPAARCGRSARQRRPSTTTATLDRAERAPASSSRCRAPIAVGDQTGARELVEREQRLPVHPRRGHRLRPDRPERRLLRRHRRAAGARRTRPRPAPPRPGGHHRPVPERAHLQDGARPERPDAGPELVDPDRRRRRAATTTRRSSTSRTTSRRREQPPDQGGPRQPPADVPGATNARLWRHDLEHARHAPVAEVDQSQDPAALPGAWESSGIVDASRWLGKDTFLIDVQAHSLLFDRQQENVYGDSRLDVTTKREGGQLLAVKLPGA